MPPMAKYQGWASWATWNIALWFGNEEPLYRAIVREYKRNGRFTTKTAMDFVLEYYPEGTPDMDKLSKRELAAELDKVSWREIAADFNEMGKGG